MTVRGSARLAAAVLEQSERRLTAEEARAYLGTPVSDREREDILALIRWFRRRYPHPAERLAYARLAYARWLRSRS